MTDRECIQGISKLIGLEFRMDKECDGSRLDSRAPSFYQDERGNVTSLNLTRLSLNSAPLEIGDLTHLRSLRLSANRIEELPDSLFENLKSLEILGLNGNFLSSLPQSISSLSSLKILKLNNNILNELPTVLRDLKSIVGMFIGSNRLDQLPEWLGDMEALEELSFAANPVDALPLSLKQLIWLRHLNISGTKIHDLTPAAGLSEITALNIRGTPVSQISDLLGLWRKLVSLDISSTLVVDLPPSISKCSALLELRLANLQLTSLPDELFELPRLQLLDLSGTHVRSIPEAIGRLRSLRYVDFGGMGLSSVPAQLFTLPNLSDINLSGNRLRELPMQVVEPELTWFFVGHQDDDGLHLTGNPFEIPPLEVVKKGRAKVATYFQSFRGSKRSIDEVKVMLIGDGGSGKTSLVNRLLGRNYDPNEKQTHGINIDDYAVSFANRRLTVHVWDFGGQEIMHATHQFFLSKRSVYVLVLDGRREEKTEYWLKHVEAFGGDSPVIIVINKIDENRSFDVNRRFLTEKYRNIRGIQRVSCATPEGIAQFERLLSATLARLDHARTVWPASWFSVKERIELLRDDFISSSMYRAICEECGVNEASEQEALIEFLHDLGIALRFSDLPLRDTNVINPRWLTQGVYKIVNSEQLASSGGILDTSKIGSILPRKVYPLEKHHFMIEIMKKFELCYQLDSLHVLLPALLPIDEPSISIANEPSIRFVIEYDFLPKSVLPRLIVRMHQDIDDNLQWRSGVVLRNGSLGARAVIRQDEAERKIVIVVYGELRREYLGIVAHAFREINESFEKINAVEKVPMPDRSEVTVTYKHLLRLQAKGIRTYIPDGTDREYDVQELLGNVTPEPKTDAEVLQLLHQLVEKEDTADTLTEKANKVLMLQPNFFGVGLNINALIERVTGKQQRR
jgi:small GTP-binding protein